MPTLKCSSYCNRYDTRNNQMTYSKILIGILIKICVDIIIRKKLNKIIYYGIEVD